MKKTFIAIGIGLFIVILGIVLYNVETKNYYDASGINSGFMMKEEKFEYNISKDNIVTITNSGIDTNIQLNIDNSINGIVKIVVLHPEITEVTFDYSFDDENKKNIVLDYDSDLLLNFDSLGTIFNVWMNGLKNKTNYNYSVLEYPIIKIYVNENNKEQIRLVGRYGNEH